MMSANHLQPPNSDSLDPPSPTSRVPSSAVAPPAPASHIHHTSHPPTRPSNRLSASSRSTPHLRLNLNNSPTSPQLPTPTSCFDNQQTSFPTAPIVSPSSGSTSGTNTSLNGTTPKSYFNFQLNSNKPTLFIPSLDDILDNNPESCITPYNRVNFVQFLSNSHCLENLEFIIELNSLIKLIKDENPDDYNVMLINWQIIHRNFLMDDSPKEINVPHSIKLVFNYDQVPDIEHLTKAKLIIYELLLDSYNEFIKYIKLTNKENGLNYRRRSEIVAPLDSPSPNYDPAMSISNHPPASAPPHFRNFNSSSTIPRSTIEEHRITNYNNDELDLSDDDHHHSKDFSLDEGLETGTPESQTNLQHSQNRHRGSSTSTNMTSSRHNSATSSSSSRGSSLGSLVENLKSHDYVSWKKTVKKFKLRRFSNQNLHQEVVNSELANKDSASATPSPSSSD